MKFGLIGVDRTTQERTVKPSARLLGEIARSNKLVIPGPDSSAR
jgi:beta-glucosidase